MKTNLILLAVGALLAAGCTTVYEPVGPGQPASVTVDHTVLNNTSWKLNLTQDGKIICTGLRPGQSMPVRPRLFGGTSVVVATGYTEDEKYVGAAAWTFVWNLPEVWIVSGLAQAAR